MGVRSRYSNYSHTRSNMFIKSSLAVACYVGYRLLHSCLLKPKDSMEIQVWQEFSKNKGLTWVMENLELLMPRKMEWLSRRSPPATMRELDSTVTWMRMATPLLLSTQLESMVSESWTVLISLVEVRPQPRPRSLARLENPRSTNTNITMTPPSSLPSSTLMTPTIRTPC